MKLSLLLSGLAMATLVSGFAQAAECTLPADAQAGKTASVVCRTCHVFDVAKKPFMGPNLHDIYGEPAGSRKDFRYSDAMAAANGKGLVWNDQTLFDYVGDPKVFLTKVNGEELKHLMTFRLADEQKRKDIIAFLKAIKGKPDCN